LPTVRIFAGNLPNGAERRTMRNAAWSSAALPELRSTLGPPSFIVELPSWKIGMDTTSWPYSLLAVLLREIQRAEFFDAFCIAL
jgi:hypothetical protein